MKSRRLVSFALFTGIFLSAAATVSAAVYITNHPSAGRRWIAALRGTAYLGPNPGGVLQQTPYDCGPAALKIALLHFGVDSPLSDLAADAGTTQRGTSLLGLKTACERRGLTATGWKLTFAALQTQDLPVLVQLDGDHFVIVREMGGRDVVVNDPTTGTVIMSKQTFLSRWSGYTLTLARKDGTR